MKRGWKLPGIIAITAPAVVIAFGLGVRIGVGEAGGPSVPADRTVRAGAVPALPGPAVSSAAPAALDAADGGVGALPGIDAGLLRALSDVASQHAISLRVVAARCAATDDDCVGLLDRPRPPPMRHR